MAKTPLTAGYNIIINQKVGGVNTPIYPFTRTANVKNASGETLDDIIATLATKAEAHYVPATEEEVSNLRFLRNDNTWAEIQSASTTQKGVVQLSDSVSTDDSTVAATATAVKTVKDAVDTVSTDLGAKATASTVTGDDAFAKIATLKTEVDAVSTDLGAKATAADVAGDDAFAKIATLKTAIEELDGGSENKYVAKTQLGVATTGEGDDQVVGVATLGTDGRVPAAQLPSYVDDVVEYADLTAFPAEGETSKIYVALDTNKTYRWGGTEYVVISETLALGETDATAFRGDLGKVAYEHSQADHARVDATKVENSEDNGYIVIDGTKTLVYSHPGTGTNPHGTTAADLGLDKVENKTSEDIRGELTTSDITNALGYTPQNGSVVATKDNDGVMSSTQAAKLDNCMEIEVSEEAPQFTNGLWFQVVSQD